jgi:hypothetical protein
MDAIGALFASGLAAYLVYGPRIASANKVGFSLNMAVAFSAMILWLVHKSSLIGNLRIFIPRLRRWVRILNELVSVPS